MFRCSPRFAIKAREHGGDFHLQPPDTGRSKDNTEDIAGVRPTVHVDRARGTLQRLGALQQDWEEQALVRSICVLVRRVTVSAGRSPVLSCLSVQRYSSSIQWGCFCRNSSHNHGTGRISKSWFALSASPALARVRVLEICFGYSCATCWPSIVRSAAWHMSDVV